MILACFKTNQAFVGYWNLERTRKMLFQKSRNRSISNVAADVVSRNFHPQVRPR